jgi:hypothetical protein
LVLLRLLSKLNHRHLMKRALPLIAFATLLLLFATNMRAATIGFDDLPDGTHVDNQYASQGVVFTTHWFDPSNVNPADPIAHPGYAGYYGLTGGVTFDSYCNAPEYVRANFSVPVSSASVQITPFEGGPTYPRDYTLGLVLYNSSGILLGGVSTVDTYSGGIFPVILSVSLPTADVAYADFYGYYGSGGGGVNAVSFDNFTFETTSVPDGGATMLLLGGALTGLAGLRRKLRK